MDTEKRVAIVGDSFAAIGPDDRQGLSALVTEAVEGVIPGEGWRLAGTHRGHAGSADGLPKASEEGDMTAPEPPNPWRRATEFWSSASLRERSKPRRGRSRTIGSSTSRFGMAQ